ncbi:hypothetical protein TNCV_1394941 [Trichonephila clavipes]|nr:hypothetical protein TNCV_1394941 [Trichonephila clavipes]
MARRDSLPQINLGVQATVRTTHIVENEVTDSSASSEILRAHQENDKIDCFDLCSAFCMFVFPFILTACLLLVSNSDEL